MERAVEWENSEPRARRNLTAMSGKQQHFPVHELKNSGVHVSRESMRQVCVSAAQNLTLRDACNESLLARAEVPAAADLAKPHATPYHTMNSGVCASSSSLSFTASHHHHHHLSQTLERELLEHLSCALAASGLAPDPSTLATYSHQHHLPSAACHLHQTAGYAGLTHAHSHPYLPPGGDGDLDPRELEAFAERFKQRRVKLGVTQAHVGSALANLKIPGVSSLSQSTICRFESLTLSHNNMLALRPLLQAWLHEAEAAHRDTSARTHLLLNGNGERKRTSIAAPEKRSLEAYFAIQPRPSSEKIAAIAEKLQLKKHVVRVWFCNQRQKQKRMKNRATH